MTKKKLPTPEVTPPATTTSAFQNAYLRFLELSAQAAKTSAEAETLDVHEKALFECLMLNWHAGHPMSVRQAIYMESLGSPATLHKRLVKLRKKGYLQLQEVPTDKRIKLLVPAAEGFKYFESQGRNIFTAKRARKKTTASAV
jgi:DNA-binding MarR family transcriptional regulator